MISALNRTRAATLAALLALHPAASASAKSHATTHANAAVHSHNAAKQEAAAWQHQEQAMMHQQQAMMHQQSSGQGRTSTHRYPTRHSSGNRRYNHYSNNYNNRPTNAQIASGLHSVMAELNKADHDYNGHRAQAVHHLGMALRSLQPQGSNNNLGMNTSGNGNNNRVTLTSANGNRTGSNGVAGAPGNAGAAAHRMPQAQSDAHLKQAHQRLTTFQNQMANTNSNQHHQVVHNHVQKAMQELNLALNAR